MQKRASISCYTLLFIWALLLASLAGPAASAQETSRDTSRARPNGERPNIVVILADDLGYSDISPYGAEIETPHLQRLAEGGMRFTQMSNTSKCFTTRAQLLAGAYAQQVGMSDGPGRFENAVMIGEVLRRVGYRTLFVGKHHGTDNPYRWGFDHYYGLRDGAANYFNPGERHPFDPGPPAQKGGHYPRTFVFDDSVAAPYTPKRGYYSTDTWTTWALDLLKEYEDEKQPFFLYLSYQAPHDPLQAPPETIEKYDGAYDEGYTATRQARYERLVESGLISAETYPLSAPTHRAWDSLSDSARVDQARRMEVYAAMIDRMDQNIGRVMDYLEARGELENTLVLFASDNGASAEVVKIGEGPIGTMTRWASLGEDWANVSNTPFRYYKNYSYQGGVATPFIAHWPGLIEAGSRSDYVARLLDVMPTLMEISGATYPEAYRGEPVAEMQGQSLVPVFAGDQKRRRAGPLYWKWADGRAVYRDGWKLVEEKGREWELYDLYGDRSETRDLAPRSAPLVEDLARSWERWHESTAPHRTPESK